YVHPLLQYAPKRPLGQLVVSRRNSCPPSLSPRLRRGLWDNYRDGNGWIPTENRPIGGPLNARWQKASVARVCDQLKNKADNIMGRLSQECRSSVGSYAWKTDDKLWLSQAGRQLKHCVSKWRVENARLVMTR
ncbi:hypothetical protein T265_15513, partial [Opisthorchis viverrini]